MYLVLLLPAVTILFTDIASKYWVAHHLPLMGAFSKYPYGGIGVFQNYLGIEFSITHLTNKGAAWGTLGEYQFPLLILRIAMIGAMFLYIGWFNKALHMRLPVCLILAGAIGNVLDYFVYGHVIDMLHFVLWGYDFPVFNIADAAVTVGICWLLLMSTVKDCRQQVGI